MNDFLWLWSDGGPKKEPDLTVRVEKATRSYRARWKEMPARVVINPVELPAGVQAVTICGDDGKVLTVRMEAAKWMPKLHLALSAKGAQER